MFLPIDITLIKPQIERTKMASAPHILKTLQSLVSALDEDATRCPTPSQMQAQAHSNSSSSSRP